MPQMDWDKFQDAHYRPHLLIARMQEASALGQNETNLLALVRLAEALAVRGNYAVKWDGSGIQAAFEREVDAERVCAMVAARTTAGSPEWASQSVFRMDSAIQKKVTNVLAQRRSKAGKPRSR